MRTSNDKTVLLHGFSCEKDNQARNQRSINNRSNDDNDNANVYDDSSSFSNNNSNNNERCLWIGRCVSRRLCTVIMIFLGIMMVYMMRVNLSIAIEPMSCQYNWDKSTQGYILSSFFIGYFISNIPASYLSVKYGGKLVFSIGVLATAIFTIIIPFCVTLNSEIIYNPSESYTVRQSCICSSQSDGNDWCFYKGIYTTHQDKCSKIINASDNICNDDSNVALIIVLRILTGLFEGVTFPAYYQILSHWTLENERSIMAGIPMAGTYFGNFIGFPLTNEIIKRASWIYVFYIFGFMGILWYILNLFFMYDNIYDDPYITKKEFLLLRDNIEVYNTFNYNTFTDAPTTTKTTIIDINNTNNNNNNGKNNKNNKNKAIRKKNVFDSQTHIIPWKNLFTNKQALLLYSVHFTTTWGFYTLLVELPTFLNSALDYNLNNSDLVLSIPYFVQFLLTYLSSLLADYLIKNRIISKSKTRKIFQFLGSIIPGILLLICGYIHTNNNSDNSLMYIIVLMIIAIGMMALSNPGIQSTYLDVSPTLSNVFYAISNTFATLPGVISPIVTGYIRQEIGGIHAWRIVFWISFILFVYSGVAFALFAKIKRISELNIQRKV